MLKFLLHIGVNFCFTYWLLFFWEYNVAEKRKEVIYIIKDLAIEVGAAFVKSKIWKSKLDEDGKDALDFAVDVVKGALKQYTKSDIEKIKETALECDVEKIVALEYSLLNGEKRVLFIVYGGNVQKFFSRLGISEIPLKNNEELYQKIQECEDVLGSVIYEKDSTWKSTQEECKSIIFSIIR